MADGQGCSVGRRYSPVSPQLASWLLSCDADPRTVLTTLTFVLLNKLPTTWPPQEPLRALATFCGLSGTALAVFQYAPQIVKTANAGLVGALSIGTMAIQVPGSIVFCVSIMLGEHTDWTSWMPYAVTGMMQACLLVSLVRG